MLKDLIKVLRGQLSWRKFKLAQECYGVAIKERAEAHEKNLRLIATIRDMDQTIWTMGQQPSWEWMRPYYLDLQMGMNERKKIENDRIRGLMVGEIVEAYNTPINEPNSPNPGGVMTLEAIKRLEKKS